MTVRLNSILKVLALTVGSYIATATIAFSSPPDAETILELLRAYDEQFLSSYEIEFREDFLRNSSRCFNERATWNAKACGHSGKHILLEERESFSAKHPVITTEILKNQWSAFGANGLEKVAWNPVAHSMFLEESLITQRTTYEAVVASTTDGKIHSVSQPGDRSIWKIIEPYDVNHEGQYFYFIRALGRAYSWLLGEAISCVADNDGILTLVVETAPHAQLWTTRWELRIDPAAHYLVTEATSWYEDTPVHLFKSDGVIGSDEDTLPLLKKGTYIRVHRGSRGAPQNVMLDSCSASVDEKYFSELESDIKTIDKQGTTVIDRTRVDTSGNILTYSIK